MIYIWKMKDCLTSLKLCKRSDVQLDGAAVESQLFDETLDIAHRRLTMSIDQFGQGTGGDRRTQLRRGVPDRRRRAVLLLAALGLIAAGLWVMIKVSPQGLPRMNNPAISHGVLK